MMKKVIQSLMLILVLVSLVACGGNEEVDGMLDKANKAMEDKQYDEAIDLYMGVIQLDNQNSTAATRLAEARELKFSETNQKADEAFRVLDYKKANELYAKSVEMIGIDEKELNAIKKRYKESMDLEKKQIEFDGYVAWQAPILEKYFKISSSWENTSSSYVVGATSAKEFEKTLTEMVKTLNGVKESIENKSFDIQDESLLVLHNEFSEKTKVYTREMVMVLGQIKKATKETKPEDVVNHGRNLDTIKTELSVYVNRTKGYADTGKLKYEYKLPNEKSDES